jgi:uncharacterized protein (DUF1015 family)
MATIRPFKAFRPKSEFASEVAARPYDVLNSDEAREEVKGHPFSFLHVGKPEVDLDLSMDLHDTRVYEKGKENLQKLISKKILVEDSIPSIYIYAQTMGEHTQYGLVGCASVDEYWNETIKKHEFTREDKEADRCNHVRETNSHSGPIFLIYRDNKDIDDIVSAVVITPPENDFIALDGIRHRCWVIKDTGMTQKIVSVFKSIPRLYIADGHHRSAAAAIVGRERMKANPNHQGNEEYNFFLAVYFPGSQLRIMPYNRVAKDLNGLTKDIFFVKVGEHFEIREDKKPVSPTRKGEMGMYLEGVWYTLRAGAGLQNMSDPVEKLDVSVLQKYILDPILGIHDPRTDTRIDFVGGIRGLHELEKRVNSGDMKIAFSMYPTSVEELMAIADEGKIMPPKSTWFEPKLRDGLFVHFLD